MALPLFRRGGNQKAEMTFVDHLEVLRWHIIRSAIAVAVGAIFIFIYRQWVFDNVIAGPINPNFISYRMFCDLSHWLHLGDALCMPPVKVDLQITTVGGKFMAALSISIIGGFIVAFPFIFWEFWRFIRPALKPSELKYSALVISAVSFFFFMGAAFGYFVLGPFTFNFLSNFELGAAVVVDNKPILADYQDMLVNILLGCGLAFELPVLAVVLTKLGLITPDFLKKKRKYAIVIILVAAGIITPSPDWISQLLVFIPLIFLYELSIILSKRSYKSMKKKEIEEWS